MIDGVPDGRAAEGCGRSFFPGSPPHSGVATGTLRELAAGISCCGAGHVRNAWFGGHLLRRERQGSVAELPQNVITAAPDFSLHRRG